MYFIHRIKAPEYHPKLPVLSCSCSHPRCNGFYIQSKQGQISCYWSYVDKSYLTNKKHAIITPLLVNINLTKENYMPQYSDEQKTDIEERSKKGLEALQELQLFPQAIVTKGKIETTNGVELFADKVQPFLADTKYIVEGDVYIEKKEDVESCS